MKQTKYSLSIIILATVFFANTLESQADILSEHYQIIKKKKSKKRYYKKRKKIVLSDPKKWQTGLTYLGYYNGAINGNMNSFDTHQAISQFQKAHQFLVSGLLNREQKDYLFYVYNVSTIDTYLNYKGTNKKSNGKRYQAALKVHGVYTDEIDGLIGKGTKKSIVSYKQKVGLSSSNSKLTDTEKEELIYSAKKLLEEQKIVFQYKEDRKTLQDENTTMTTIAQDNLQENSPTIDQETTLVFVEKNQNTIEANKTDQTSESTSSISDDIANITQEIMQTK